MTDPDKLAAFKAMAGDLGKSMKDKVLKAGEEEAERKNAAKVLQAKLNVEREKMLRILENDIDAMGWDQSAKMYAVTLAEDGSEMLEFIDQIQGHPIDSLLMIAARGTLVPNCVAFVVASEHWRYPEYLRKKLETNHRARAALFNLYPPNLHPERVEGRTVTLVDRTGQAVSLQRDKDAGVEPTGYDGEMVSAIKCVLGIDEEFNRRVQLVGKSFQVIKELFELFGKNNDNCWTEQMYVEEVEKILTKLHKDRAHEIALELMATMPTFLRRSLGLE